MLNREHGKTIVMVTHDPKAAEYASRRLMLDKGTWKSGGLTRHSPGAVTRSGLTRICRSSGPGSSARRRARSSRSSRSSWRSCCFGLLEAVTVAFESGADSADAKRLLTTARYSIIEPLPHRRTSAGSSRCRAWSGVAHADWFGAKYQNESNAFPVFAVDPQRYLAMYPEFDDRARRSARPSPRRAPARSPAAASSSASAGSVGQKLPDQLGDPRAERTAA